MKTKSKKKQLTHTPSPAIVGFVIKILDLLLPSALLLSCAAVGS